MRCSRRPDHHIVMFEPGVESDLAQFPCDSKGVLLVPSYPDPDLVDQARQGHVSAIPPCALCLGGSHKLLMVSPCIPREALIPPSRCFCCQSPPDKALHHR